MARGGLLRMLLGAAFTWAALSAVALGDEPPKAARPSLNDLSLEVSALQTLYALNATPVQLAALRKLAGQTADESSPRQAPKASDKFAKTLADQRLALVEAKDDDRINRLADEVEQLREGEKPELDDGVDLTDEARERAPKVLKTLSARQVAAYVGTSATNLPDPSERLLGALGKVRGLSPKEWKELRNQVGDEVGWLVGGIDADKAARVNDRVVQLLIMARDLKDEEFKAQRPELEKTARQIVGDLGPFDMLRNVVEHDLAVLLSNPRLAVALDARLKRLHDEAANSK